MASAASLPPAARRSPDAPPSSHTLRGQALERLSIAIARAVESASDDTLAAILSAPDFGQALAIAPRDLVPPPPERLAAEMAARARTAQFRADMAAKAGGMYDRHQLADLLGVQPAAIDKQRQRRQILGVPYGNEIRYPAAQIINGETVADLKSLLEAFGDMAPWGQLQLLVTPIEGFGPTARSIFDILADRPDASTLRQLRSLVAGWAA